MCWLSNELVNTDFRLGEWLADWVVHKNYERRLYFEGGGPIRGCKPTRAAAEYPPALPTPRISSSSASPFPLLHHLHKILEQIMRVMRPRRGLRVILHAEQRQISMAQPFQRLVVQVDVRQFNFILRQRIRIHREIMVVRRDLDLAGLQLLHRMVPTVMSELKLECFPTQRDAGELMSETYPKDRVPSQQSPNRIDRIGTRLRIAGAIGEKYSIRFQRHYIFGQGLRGNHRNPAAFTT